MDCRAMWTSHAEEDLDATLAYITIDLGNPQAASHLLDELENAVRRIESMPELYAISKVPPLAARRLRACFVANYVLLYQYDGGQVLIRRILYAKSNYGAVISRDEQ